MTTAAALAKSPRPAVRFHLPDPPPRQPDEMTSYIQIRRSGNSHRLIQHLGNPDTALASAERYIIPERRSPASDRRAPHLLSAFNVNPAAYHASNGYIIAEQGKPPDSVMEVAARSATRADTNQKRLAYAAFGIPEYWGFDESGRWHGTRLAGDRLVQRGHRPIPINRVGMDILERYRAALNLHIRWERGQLGRYDLATSAHIHTCNYQRDRAEARAAAAKARNRALENELRRLRNR